MPRSMDLKSLTGIMGMARRIDMDREAIMKELNRILDKYGINPSDRESLLDDLYKVVDDVHFDGYCKGSDENLVVFPED